MKALLKLQIKIFEIVSNHNFDGKITANLFAIGETIFLHCDTFY